MGKLDQVRSLFELGAVFECVENTYRPALNGSRRCVTKVGATFYDCELLDGENAGQSHHNFFPKRASDVVEVSDSSVTYRLGRADHTVTLRRVGRSEGGAE